MAIDDYLIITTLPGTPLREAAPFNTTTVIGRSQTCDIVLSNRLVSRKHASISVGRDGRITAHDLNSRNGTWVGAVLLKGSEHLVDEGADVKIGPYVLRLFSGGGGDEETLSEGGPCPWIRIDAVSHTVLLEGSDYALPLPELELSLLIALSAHWPEVVPSETLGNAVWGAGSWENDMIHGLVRRVRTRLLHAYPEISAPIENVRGVGYRLTGFESE